jgi:16S rRNA (guanine527-N7)-methyltransferase
MDTTRIAELLQPFLGPAEDPQLTVNDLSNISTYIDLLLRWNARVNLTAIRQPEEIVTRHFGESLFAARHLFPSVARTCPERSRMGPSPAREADAPARPAEQSPAPTRLIDIGSGAGFPGLPIKVWATHIHLALIESNQKKATFLREVARALTLTNVNVFPGRAEDYPNPPAEVVTLRAVERFETVLPTAARLTAPHGRLALLISAPQLAHTYALAPGFAWLNPIGVPLSSSRIFLLGVRKPEE